MPETSRFGISRPAPQTSSKIYTIQNNSGPAQIFNTPASTKTPSVDEDFSVMYYNHSQAGFKYKNLEKSDEDTEHYAFSGKTIEVKGTELKIHYYSATLFDNYKGGRGIRYHLMKCHISS